MGGLGLVFCVIMFVLSCRVLVYFRSVEVIGDFLARYLLSMILLTFFSLLIFSHIITALSNLYLSKDLELCHSTPVGIETVFVSRAIYTFMDASWMLIIFGVPIFLAYAYVFVPGPGFYLTLLHMNIAMAVIAAGIGILVTMALVYTFPAQRTRDIILLLSILMGMGLYLMFRFLRPERLVNPEAFFSVLQYVSALKGIESPYLPPHWIARTLWGSLTGSRAGAHLFEIILTWSTAGAMVVINIWTARVFYFEGFSKTQEAKTRLKGGKRVLDLFVRLVTRPFRGDLSAIMAKDIRAFFRDNSQWSQLLLLGALIVVYVYNFSVLPLDKSPIRLDFLQNGVAFLNMGLAGFVISAVSARFVFTAVSAEGEAYWIIHSSPVRPGRYLWGKYLLFLVPMLVLAEVLIIVTNYFLDVTGLMMFLSSVTMFFMVFGIVALAMGLGAVYPNFRHQSIARVSTGFGGLLYMMVSSLFVALVIVLEAGPGYILYLSRAGGNPVTPYQWVFIIFSFLASLAVNALAVVRPMRMGQRALEGYE